MNLKNYIATIDDFPIDGVKFRDITPLMANGKAFAEATRLFVEFAKKVGAEVIVGPVKELGAEVVGCGFLIELEDLKGREALDDIEVFTIMKY